MRLAAMSMLFTLSLVVGLLPTEGRAGVITVMIGDDDGFGGTQGSHSHPGDPFSVFDAPSIVPGTYLNEAGLDATTTVPFTPYIFQFVFAYDATSLASITGATVTIQSGSVGRRDDGSGFGFASVSADGGAGPTSLGQFWTTSTGGGGSRPEELVKAHVFDVTPLITSSMGTLILTIDGSALPNAGDQFALDFALLTIAGSAVPEPSTFSLSILALVGTAVVLRRKATKAVRPA